MAYWKATDPETGGPLVLGTTRGGKTIHIMRDGGGSILTPQCNQPRKPFGGSMGRRTSAAAAPTCKYCLRFFTELNERTVVLRMSGAEFGELQHALRNAGTKAQALLTRLTEAASTEEQPSGPPEANDCGGPGAAGELAPGEATQEIDEALAAWRASDPDSPKVVRIIGAERRLDGNGRGYQTYRRVVYPGRKTSEWVDCARMPSLGGRNVEARICESYGEVPIGSLILEYESQVANYRKAQAELRIGLVTAYRDDHGYDIHWLDFRRLRARAACQVTLPHGEMIEIEVER